MPSTKGSAVRARAGRAGYRVLKSRRALCLENRGEYMLVDCQNGSLVVLGHNYDASLETR
jgi:hypothetical protein